MANRLGYFRPDLVWVLDTPKQNPSLNGFSSRQGGRLVAAGGQRLASFPEASLWLRWMRRSGSELALRLGTQPRRLGRRYLVGNAVFLIAFAEQPSLNPNQAGVTPHQRRPLTAAVDSWK